jgi:alpha-tubulin suppressor-like RCC1 family protein
VRISILSLNSRTFSRASRLAALASLSVVSVCSDSPTGPTADLSALVVSDTADAASAGVTSGLASLTLDGQPTYVSLPSGAVPDGTYAIVRNPRTMQTVEREFIDGGFDPVAIIARPGDELEIEVLRHAAASYRTMITVPARRRPRIVRTAPPREKRDVPLNLRLSVVFSEPLDQTFDSPPLRLMRGTTEVPGRWEVDADGLALGFVPDAPLAAGTTYRLIVANDIRDRDGDPIELASPVDFTTGNSVIQASTVSISADTLWALTTPYDFARIAARAFDADGVELMNLPLRWSSSDVSILDPYSSGMDDGRNFLGMTARGRSGSVAVHASYGSVSDSVIVILEAQQLSSVSMGGNGLLCFISTDRHAYCRGNNHEGELGSLVEWAQFPVRVGGGNEFKSVTAGIWHACGLTSEGLAYCWGSNRDGKAGPGPETRVMLPQLVSADLSFRQLSAGIYHTCGITEDGKAYCWGTQWGPASEGLRQPGPTSNTPVPIAGDQTFVQIDAGYGHTCALTETGAAYCWGGNTSGQLGNGSTTSSATAVAVAGGLQFRHVSAGPGHSCGVTTDGQVYCWGKEGDSGYTGTLPPSTTPLQVRMPDGVTLTTLDVGDGPTCGLATGGETYCWGFVWDADAVETGFGPMLLPGGLQFTAIDKTCGVTSDPATYCWAFRHAEPAPSVLGPYYVEGQP